MKFEEKEEERFRSSYRRNLVGARWAKDPPTLFLRKNRLFGKCVEKGQIKKQKYFVNSFLGGVKTEKSGKP